jgi:hypothetical protein
MAVARYGNRESGQVGINGRTLPVHTANQLWRELHAMSKFPRLVLVKVFVAHVHISQLHDIPFRIYPEG